MTPPQTEHRKGGRTRRAVISAVLAVTLSAGGAAAWALDRFVVPHAEITNVSEYEASQAGTTDQQHDDGRFLR